MNHSPKNEKSSTSKSQDDCFYLTNPNMMECEHCDRRYNRKDRYYAHFKKYHSDVVPPDEVKQHVAEEQPSVSTGVQYKRIAPTKNPILFKCEDCERTYTRKDRFTAHFKKFHIDDGVVPPGTINPVKSDGTPVKPTTYECKDCERTYTRKDRYTAHFKKFHINDGVCPPEATITATTSTSTDTPTSTPPDNNEANTVETTIFECKDCERTYTRKDRYTAHFKKFHGEDNVIAPPRLSRGPNKPQQPKNPPRTNYLCPLCGTAFNRHTNFIVHMRRHTGEKPFKCDICGKGFPRTTDLYAHVRTHTNERPFKCTLCDKAFSRSYKLNIHQRVHTGERPYQCTYCERGFIQSNDLTIHLRRHTGERPYRCEPCGENFICSTTLKTHYKSKRHMEATAMVEALVAELPEFKMSLE